MSDRRKRSPAARPSGEPPKKPAQTGQTGVPVELPQPGDPKCKLVGGRKCKIDGQPAAFAVYEMNGLPASLLVVPGDTADLGDRVAKGGLDEGRWVEHWRGYTVVARRRGDLVYAAVSTLGEDDLLCLVAGAVHESD
ncbi:MAG: hypothetical protein IID40_03040 [Planctomycetes bacterium]|nr:hypothetical protein [Planctomycetota bacterium]